MAASLVTLVSGGSYADREAWIAAALTHEPPLLSMAAILEGLPDGQPLLTSNPLLALHRVAPGCMCCIGNLVMRVTLNRILRKPPVRLYLGLADNQHIKNLVYFLQQPPYNELIEFDQDIRLGS
ncbi:GTPase [Undibacterium parvum]|uniref:GTPase n=1 Tax=Undibacterium parvum TaxID=401471 RepID=A0A3S9HJM1_9BURK|nr:GTPase [Undibacterium parvum]AZP12302.1 GTPase [Undibacterium parvum]